MSSNSPISNVINNYVGGTGVNYINSATQQILQGNVEKSDRTQLVSTPDSDGLFVQDIAQSHHYTVQLSGMSMSKFKTPGGTFSKFLPVKNMSLKYTSYENMSIPLTIFGDFPLLNKKRVSTIDLTCYDLDSSKLEYELRLWESQCFPKGRFVAYMSDIARKFEYRGYNVKGQESLYYKVWVIPSGNVTVSRDYSANEAKMINFSLVVVGDGQTCSSGNGKVPTKLKGETPIKEHGWTGDKEEAINGPYHTLFLSGYGKWNSKDQQMESYDL